MLINTLRLFTNLTVLSHNIVVKIICATRQLVGVGEFMWPIVKERATNAEGMGGSFVVQLRFLVDYRKKPRLPYIVAEARIPPKHPSSLSSSALQAQQSSKVVAVRIV